MNIRLLNEEDAAIFRALRLKAVIDAPSAFTESINEIMTRTVDDYADQLRLHGKGDFVTGAFNDHNVLIGMVGFYCAIHDKQSHRGTLWGMYVTPEGRQQGVGGALITAAIEHAKKLPALSNITLCVTSSNKAARRLYESKGFRVCGTEKRALKIDGVYFDEMLMQLLLR